MHRVHYLIDGDGDLSITTTDDRYEKPMFKPEDTAEYQSLSTSTMQGSNEMCAVNPGQGGPGDQDLPPNSDEQSYDACT